MKAKIEVTKTLLATARALQESPDPEARLAAKEYESYFQQQLEDLEKNL